MIKIIGRKFFDTLGRETNFPKGAQDDIITDEITVRTSFNFFSTLNQQVTIESPISCKLTQGNWNTLSPGDSVNVKYDVEKLDPSTGDVINYPFDGVRTIESIEGGLLTFVETQIPFVFQSVVGESLPSTYNSPLRITFDPVKEPELIDTYYNLISNENDGGAESLIDGAVNRITFDVEGMGVSDVRDGSIIGDKSGGAFLEAKIEKLATNRYKLTYKYWNWVKFELLDTDRPDVYDNESSLKPYFEIIARREKQNPNVLTENKFAFLEGSFGWYNQLYNLGDMPWSFKSVIFKDPDGNITTDIDYSKNTDVEIILQAGANFDSECIVSIYKFPQLAEDYKNKLTPFQDNVFATIAVEDTGVTVQKFGLNGAELDITALTTDTSTANELKITFTTVPNAEYTASVEATPENERFYRLGVTAQLDDDTWASDLARTGLLTKAPIIGGEITEITDFGFLNHSEPLSNCGCIFGTAFTEDDILAKGILKFKKAENYESFRTSFRLVKESTGEFFELWQNGRTINLLNYPIDNDGVRFIDYEEDLGYNLPSEGRNTLLLKTTLNDTATEYEVNFRQTLILSWRKWVAKPNALTDFLDLTLPNNGLNDEWVRYALEGFKFIFRLELVKDGVTYFKNYEIEIKDYDSTDVESDINLKTSEGEDVNVIVNGDIMEIVATHEHPTPWDITNVWGWIAIRGKNQDPRPLISSIWDHTNQNAPLQPLTNETKTFLDFPTPNIARLRARVNTLGLSGDSTIVSRVNSPMVEGGIPFGAFIFDAQTDNEGDTLDDEMTVQTTGAGYNYNIYWYEIGNPNNNGFVLENTGNTVIKFPSVGEYRIGITGDFPRIYFNNEIDAKKVTNIVQWGTNVWQSMRRAFVGCENLKATITAEDAPNLTECTSLESMFEACILFNSNINHWNVLNITTMNRMFRNTTFNQPLDSWNVSNVTGMNNMFNFATAFNQSLNTWNVSNVENMNNMFNNATAFNQPLNTWNVSNVTGMNNMFNNATAFNQPLDSWNVSNVTDMNGMFNGATAFNQSLNTWNVSNVTNMSAMFNFATAFNQPLNTWDVSKVTSMTSMLRNTSFNQPLNTWNVSNVTNMSNMLRNTPFNQDISSWNVSNVTDMNNMFNGATAFNQPLNSWNVSNVTNINNMFDGASAFNQLLGSWNLSNLSTANRVFSNSGMSTANYTDTIVGWANFVNSNSDSPSGVDMEVQTGMTYDTSRDGGASFADADAARTYLTTTPVDWVIDGDTIE